MTGLTSVRARTTAASVIVFALTLTIASVLLVGTLRQTMVSDLDTTMQLRGDDLKSLIESGASPTDISIEDSTDGFVQFVTNGVVSASSANVIGEAPIVSIQTDAALTSSDHPLGEDDPFRIVVVHAQSDAGRVSIIVGNTLEDVTDAVHATSRALVVGVPALVLVAGLMTWAAVGRALKPVESIRAEVAEIGATDLHRRVPEPKSGDEIGRLAHTMNDMLDRIESGTHRQQRFVADASHELRTPIAAIRHRLEVALAHPDTAQWESIAANVLDDDLRMQRLVDDLLWLARHDGDNVARRMSLVDLDEIVITQTRAQRVEADVPIGTTRVGAGQIRGNADDLRRVVSNLLNNATRHATSRVELNLTTPSEGYVRLCVEDDGVGVPAEIRESILERFFRGDEARTRDAGGAGLGLAIVLEIVTEHGASLTIDSSPMGGARFCIDFADARAT